MQGLKPFILPGLAALFLIGLLVLRPSDSDFNPDPHVPAASPPRSKPKPAAKPDSPTPGPTDRDTASADPPAAAPPSVPDTRPESPEKDLRDALYGAVTETLAASGDRATRLPTAYVRAQITGALSRAANTCAGSAPGGGGGSPVSMQITILGAASTGAVLDAVAVAPASAEKHAGLVRCLTHALLNAVLPAPPASGAVTMVYPFTVGGAGAR